MITKTKLNPALNVVCDTNPARQTREFVSNLNPNIYLKIM